MFFLKQMERTITLHPTYFGPRIRDYLIDRLKQDVEGTNLGNFYVLLILDNPEISEGRVVPSSGYAEYTMNYRAVIWRPFRGEVLDGVVGSVVAHGFLVNIGPMDIFVSRHLIPKEYDFDGNATPPQFANNEEGLIIENGTKVRVKVMGVRAEVGVMYGIGTIKEDYLGFVDLLLLLDSPALTYYTDLLMCTMAFRNLQVLPAAQDCS